MAVEYNLEVKFGVKFGGRAQFQEADMGNFHREEASPLDERT